MIDLLFIDELRFNTKIERDEMIETLQDFGFVVHELDYHTIAVYR